MRWFIVNRDLDQIGTDDTSPTCSQAPCVAMEQREGTFVLVDRDGCPRTIPMMSATLW